MVTHEQAIHSRAYREEFVQKAFDIKNGKSIEISLTELIAPGVLPEIDLEEISRGTKSIPLLLRPVSKPMAPAHYAQFTMIPPANEACVSVFYPTTRLLFEREWYPIDPRISLMQSMNPRTNNKKLRADYVVPEGITLTDRRVCGFDESAQLRYLGDEYSIFYHPVYPDSFDRIDSTEDRARYMVQGILNFDSLLRLHMEFQLTASAELYHLAM